MRSIASLTKVTVMRHSQLGVLISIKLNVGLRRIFLSPVHTSDAESRRLNTAAGACRRRQLPPSLSRADQTKKYKRSSVVAYLCQRMS